MKISYYILPLVTTAALVAGCSASRQPANESKPLVIIPGRADREVAEASKPRVLPKAMLYKTDGDFSANVPVQLNDDGSLRSYPDPRDIPADARPVMLAGGWLLSPVGVGYGSVFTSYTLEKYRSMDTAPAPAEILGAVIPGSKVTATIQIPLSLSEALADTAAVNRIITELNR